MTKNEILNDMKFRQICENYGLDWNKFNIYYFKKDFVILLNVPNKDIYLLLDKNYNIFCIEKNDLINDYKDMKYFVKARYDNYCYSIEDLNLWENFVYPFEKLTLKQILDLSNLVVLSEKNKNTSTYMNFGEHQIWINFNEIYIGLLSYIKFLGEQIKQYYLMAYQMKMLGGEFPDVEK